MRKSIITSVRVLLAMLLSLGYSCGLSASPSVNVDRSDEKPTVKKSVKIGDFDEIQASQGIEIIYTVGTNTGKAEISTTPSAEKYITVEVKNKKLRAYYNDDNYQKNIHIKGPSIVRVSGKSLDEVSLSSGASVKIVGDLNVANEFELDMSSGSSFKCSSLKCSVLDADITSSASASISSLDGKAKIVAASAGSVVIENMKGAILANAASAGTIKVSNANSSSIIASAASSGGVTIKKLTADKVTVSAASAGKITLSGSAKTYTHSVSSGATIDDNGLSVLNR